ncbi:MAG TPA: flagellar motor switch protein FliG [Candidatus Latescibacteria bacterium]|nr:flagellar motor switch protein FliG [Candidatus Latescibacterota bacterium]
MVAKKFSNSRKAAIILVSLGREAASGILKHLDESEIEGLTREIANLRDVSSEDKEAVLEEFHKALLSREFFAHGGYDYARDVLAQALGKGKADEILHRMYTTPKAPGLRTLKNLDPHEIAEFVKDEHPQTISLILSQLRTAQAATILSQLPPELQGEVAWRMATMERVSPNLIREVEETLESQLEAESGSSYSISGGAKTVAEILNLTDRATERAVLKMLEEQDPEMAVEVKNLMFVFEDILLLDDSAVQKVMREVDIKQLSLALKAAGEDVKEKIFHNVSERVATMVKEEIEYMGPVRLKDVEGAQQKIVEIIRRLEDEGEIIIYRGGEGEEVIV